MCSVRQTELYLTSSVWFGQNGKTQLRSVTRSEDDLTNFNSFQIKKQVVKTLQKLKIDLKSMITDLSNFYKQ